MTVLLFLGTLLLFEHAAVAAQVTIDVSALSAASAVVNGSTNANFTGSTTFDLAPGPFTVSTTAQTPAGGVDDTVAFQVNADGTVELRPFARRRARRVGHRDARRQRRPRGLREPGALDPSGRLEVDGAAVPFSLNLLPGAYSYYVIGETFASGVLYNSFDFTVNADGTFTTAASYVTGGGTSAMTVVGFPVQVTTAIDSPHQGVLEIDGQSGLSYTLNLIPGAWGYDLATGSAAGPGLIGFDFALATDGTASVDAPTAAYVSTAGAGTLDVTGFPIQLDFRNFPGASTFFLYALADYASTSVDTVPLIPGGYEIDIGSATYFFSVTAAGTVAYDPSLATSLSGAGTTLLSYGITCTGGSDANGVALGPVASGTSVCGGGFVSYLCDATGQSAVLGMACTVGNVPASPSCACSGGSDANGVALGPIACGTSVCGGGFVSYQCDASGQWQYVGMACTVGERPCSPELRVLRRLGRERRRARAHRLWHQRLRRWLGELPLRRLGAVAVRGHGVHRRQRPCAPELRVLRRLERERRRARAHRLWHQRLRRRLGELPLQRFGAVAVRGHGVHRWQRPGAPELRVLRRLGRERRRARTHRLRQHRVRRRLRELPVQRLGAMAVRGRLLHRG